MSADVVGGNRAGLEEQIQAEIGVLDFRIKELGQQLADTRFRQQLAMKERERIKEILGEFVESEMEEDDASHALRRVSEEVLDLPWEDTLEWAWFAQAIDEGGLEELLRDPDDEEDEEESAEPGGADVG